MPFPGPTLQYKKRTVSYWTGMQEKCLLGPGSLEVATDTMKHGTDKEVKSFTYFDSRDDFFQETAYTVHRNLYKIIQAGDPCCLFFDVEHCSPSQFSCRRLPVRQQTCNHYSDNMSRGQRAPIARTCSKSLTPQPSGGDNILKVSRRCI